MAAVAGTPGRQPAQHGRRQLARQAGDHQGEQMPIDSTNAEFWNVAIMPPAAPRWLAGAEFIISAQFGEKTGRSGSH